MEKQSISFFETTGCLVRRFLVKNNIYIKLAGEREAKSVLAVVFLLPPRIFNVYFAELLSKVEDSS